jgi:hypothetical protein
MPVRHLTSDEAHQAIGILQMYTSGNCGKIWGFAKRD